MTLVKSCLLFRRPELDSEHPCVRSQLVTPLQGDPRACIQDAFRWDTHTHTHKLGWGKGPRSALLHITSPSPVVHSQCRHPSTVQFLQAVGCYSVYWGLGLTFLKSGPQMTAPHSVACGLQPQPWSHANSSKISDPPKNLSPHTGKYFGTDWNWVHWKHSGFK